MRLGFVGVGKHAQKMSAAFRECGAEVVTHDRRSTVPGDCCDKAGNCFQLENDATCYKCGKMLSLRLESSWLFGKRMPWSDMIASAAIDALIICAPPDVTTEVALACAKAGKRCVATKPLMWTKVPRDIALCNPGFSADSTEGGGDDLYVDLWRLYSPAWQALKAELRGKTIQSVSVDFYGNGPVRKFSAALDWGPHALAFAVDILGSMPRINWDDHGNVFGVNGLWTGDNGHHAGAVRLAFGNRIPVGDEYYSQAGKRRVVVRAEGRYYILLEDGEDHVLSIGGEPVMQHVKTLAIRNFCRAFLAGAPSDTLRLSCEAMKVLMPMVAE